MPELERGESLSTAAKQAVASAAHLMCRSVDIVGWLGSENVLLILPEAADAEAKRAATRLADEFWRRSQHAGGQRWKLIPLENVYRAESADDLILSAVRQHIVPNASP